MNPRDHTNYHGNVGSYKLEEDETIANEKTEEYILTNLTFSFPALRLYGHVIPPYRCRASLKTSLLTY